jgi:hypothetical protein
VIINSNEPAQIEVNAYDPDDHFVSFGFSLSPLPATQTLGRAGQPMLQKVDDYQAIFSWTPGNADVGSYALSLIIEDELGARVEETINLTVLDRGVSGGEAVRFVEPSGEVLLLDLNEGPCLETQVSLEANTLSADELSLSLGADAPPTMTLTREVAKRYRLAWCPSPEEISARSQYPISLIASNSRGMPNVEKRYLIMIQGVRAENCPGQPPTLSYEALPNQRGAANLTLYAEVTDDLGIKGTPTLSYQLTEVDQMTPQGEWVRVVMQPSTTSSVMGEAERYEALIPPPQQGRDMRLFYEVSVTDDDDEMGTACDHQVEGPTHSLVWTWDEGVSPGYGLCNPCLFDVQCGGSEDRCVPAFGELGTSLEGVCARACDEANACAVGEECISVVSLEGVESQQCIRSEGCAPTCLPDLFDLPSLPRNESAMEAALITEGVYEGMSICGQDEDWFRVEAGPHELVRVSLSFEHARGDLDLELSAPNVLPPLQDNAASSTDDELAELITPCEAEGGVELLVRVHGFLNAQNSYSLTLTREPLEGDCEQPCSDTFECPEGQYCAAGACRNDACGAEPCANNISCLSARAGVTPRAEEGMCAETCNSDNECRFDEVCKRFENYRSYCVSEGEGEAGASCEQARDCAGDQICFGVGSRGFCAQAGCGASRLCGDGEVCASLNVGGSACVIACERDETCAPLGLSCRELSGVRGCAP